MNTGDIDLIYSMCSFDKAWRPKDLSPWCAVFSEEDLQVNQTKFPAIEKLCLKIEK